MQPSRVVLSATRNVGLVLGSLILCFDRKNTTGLLMLGTAKVVRGDYEQAEKTFNRLLAEDPGSLHARLWLSRLFVKTGRIAEAKKLALEAIEVDGASSLAQAQLVECNWAADNQLPHAVCEQVAEASQMPATTYYGFGIALWGMGRSREAVSMLEKALVHNPKHMSAIQELLNIYNRLGDGPNELRLARLAVEANSDFSYQATLTLALIRNGQVGDAEDRFKELAARQQKDSGTLSQLGLICEIMGRTDEANSYFLSSIEYRPDQGFSYYWITQNKKMTSEDLEFIAKMKQVFLSDDLDLTQRESLAFAIGKSLEDLEEYEEAIRYFEEGNACGYRSHFGEEYSNKSAIPTMDRQFMDAQVRLLENSYVSHSPMPIFIVGMIRSGTSLMEQMLSSHPEIGAAGELGFWDISWDEIQKIGESDSDRLNEMCTEYCELLRSYGEGKRCVTDKRPDNFLRLGLLCRAFPTGKIIHMKRHPADNCVSILTTLNATPAPWAFQKDTIAQFYEFYSDVMAEWQSLLSPGRVLDVHYEDLINNPEIVLQRVCEFCELEWDPAVLTPEKNPRAVVTPSVAQVRRPVYSSSIARWRRFEPWLGAISNLIADEERGKTVSS